MENVEDKDDVVAADNATKEEEEVIVDDRPDPNAPKEIDENENVEIDKAMLPPIYNYGLEFLEYSKETHLVEPGVQMLNQDGVEEEEEKEEEISSEEEIDFRQESEEASEEDDTNRAQVRLFFLYTFLC